MRLLILIILILSISGCTNQETVVIRVIDGDTLETSDGKTIRLLGINAPEKWEYHYNKSFEKLIELVQYKKVVLERDSRNKDRYGRLLRYVYTDDTFVNLYLVQYGYAEVYQPGKYKEEFEKAEDFARKSKLGLWSR